VVPVHLPQRMWESSRRLFGVHAKDDLATLTQKCLSYPTLVLMFAFWGTKRQASTCFGGKRRAANASRLREVVQKNRWIDAERSSRAQLLTNGARATEPRPNNMGAEFRRSDARNITPQ
jgi:hypothetical protein